MAKTKKTTKTKVPKIETIKIGITPSTTVTYKGDKYYLLANGNYLNKTTNKEVKLVY